MTFDPDDPFDPTDPAQWARIRALPHIVVQPKPPQAAAPPDGIDDWFVPPQTDDGPDDWFVPPQSAMPGAGQVPSGAQPSAASAAAPPNPLAAFWSLIPASRIGAMAWDPPNLPLFPPPANNLPAPVPAWPPPMLPGSRPLTLGVDPPTWSSSQPPSVPALPQGGFLSSLAMLGTPPQPSRWGTGFLSSLATLGTSSSAPPAPSPAGSFPGTGSPATPPMPSTLQAFYQGLGAATRQLGQTLYPGAPSLPAQNNPAAEPLGWSDLANPSRIAPKVAYQFAQSYPTLAGGVAGGFIGGRVGALAGPEGTAAGAVVGGSLGAAALSAAQTLGPAYTAELQKTPNDPEGAWSRAWKQAEISGAFSGASWAVFPARFFQGPVKHLVFQIFGAQPALAMGERVTRNIVEGRPATEGVGEAYGQGVVGGLTPALGHAVVQRILPSRMPSGGSAPTSGRAPGSAVSSEPSSPIAGLRRSDIVSSKAGADVSSEANGASDLGTYRPTLGDKAPDWLPLRALRRAVTGLYAPQMGSSTHCHIGPVKLLPRSLLGRISQRPGAGVYGICPRPCAAEYSRKYSVTICIRIIRRSTFGIKFDRR